jgi:radical SAM superfamily enzyme YgiQ (UPF0313 family)
MNNVITQSKTFEAMLLEMVRAKLLIRSASNSRNINFIAVNPPLIPKAPFDLEVAKRQGYYNFPPTGPMYLCASIDSLNLPNVSCQVIDLNNYLLKRANESDQIFDYYCWKEAFRHLDGKDIYVFLVSYMFGTTKECYTNTALFIKERFLHSLIVTGGVQASFDKKEILESDFADVVCSNEGDLQIQYLASIIYSQVFGHSRISKPTVSLNLTVQGGMDILGDNGMLINSGPSVQPSTFDWKLEKYYDQINILNYYKHGGLGAFSKYVESYAGRPLPYSAVLTKRGCRAHCAFCTVRTFNGKGIRLRSIDTVMDELRYLYKIGIRHIDWLDDDLLYEEDYNLKLFSAIKKEFPDLLWTASNGLIGVAITPGLMDEMANSGLVAFKIGVESGNSQVIKDIRKPTTLWRLVEKSYLIRQYPHIFFSANFIVGFPGEKFSQMLDSFIFARKLRCDWSSFYVCQPLKGTDLYSSFQHLMDPRAKEESYTKTINPGRSAARGEFAYSEMEDLSEKISAGWNIFDTEAEKTFDAEAHNEIWFTFNLVANFLDNPCYSDACFTKKLIHWLTAIHSGYPFDPSMTAALSHSYRLIGDTSNSAMYADLSEELILNSNYWQKRVRAFPELLTLCGFTRERRICQALKLTPPELLVPKQYSAMFKTLSDIRESTGWRD